MKSGRPIRPIPTKSFNNLINHALRLASLGVNEKRIRGNSNPLEYPKVVGRYASISPEWLGEGDGVGYP